jgi:hypothetical protein
MSRLSDHRRFNRNSSREGLPGTRGYLVKRLILLKVYEINGVFLCHHPRHTMPGDFTSLADLSSNIPILTSPRIP